jgi:predicted transposase YdaD
MPSPSQRRRKQDQAIRYDAVLKDLFQRDSPSLLDRFAGGQRIRATLNIELARVTERRADVAFLLENGDILHIDFQGYNDRKMPYRAGIYGLMIAEKYERKVRQVVLYTGLPKLSMKSSLDVGQIQVSYLLIDIRELDAETLLRSHRPGDCALAILARGGPERLRQIIGQAQTYPGAVRSKVLAQLAVLSGLRHLSTEYKIEVMRAGIEETIQEHAFLRGVWERAEAEGLAKGIAEGIAKGVVKGKAAGKAEGKAEGMQVLLTNVLVSKFGPLPKPIRLRLQNATPAQMDRWSKKSAHAQTLDQVFGKR